MLDGVSERVEIAEAEEEAERVGPDPVAPWFCALQEGDRDMVEDKGKDDATDVFLETKVEWVVVAWGRAVVSQGDEYAD